jgi:hypothetical protein
VSCRTLVRSDGRNTSWIKDIKSLKLVMSDDLMTAAVRVLECHSENYEPDTDDVLALRLSFKPPDIDTPPNVLAFRVLERRGMRVH